MLPRRGGGRGPPAARRPAVGVASGPAGRYRNGADLAAP